MGEFRLRDLNDEINKLLREKKHWEYQIRELGGPDFLRMGPRMLDHEGREVPGNRGYKYFGAAKDLPGVRELFEHEPPPPPRRTRAELMKNIDADYYGYMDEEDGLLLAMETKKEKKSMLITTVIVGLIIRSADYSFPSGYFIIYIFLISALALHLKNNILIFTIPHFCCKYLRLSLVM